MLIWPVSVRRHTFLEFDQESTIFVDQLEENREPWILPSQAWCVCSGHAQLLSALFSLRVHTWYSVFTFSLEQWRVNGIFFTSLVFNRLLLYYGHVINFCIILSLSPFYTHLLVLEVCGIFIFSIRCSFWNIPSALEEHMPFMAVGWSVLPTSGPIGQKCSGLLHLSFCGIPDL